MDNDLKKIVKTFAFGNDLYDFNDFPEITFTTLLPLIL